MSGDFKEVKDNTEEVSDVSENGEVTKVGVSLTPSATMRRAEPRAHDPFIVCFAYEFKFKICFSFDRLASNLFGGPSWNKETNLI